MINKIVFSIFILAISLASIQQTFAGTCTCFWGSQGQPNSERSCSNSQGECNTWCQSKHNPAGILGAAWVTHTGGQCALDRGCNYDAGKSIHDLGYSQGNKFEFCLSKGYNRFESSQNYCWNAPCDALTNDKKAQTSEERKGLYDICMANKSDRCCDHLSAEDATKFKVCGEEKPQTSEERKGLYDVCMANKSDRCCDHLSTEDATKFKVCGK